MREIQVGVLSASVDRVPAMPFNEMVFQLKVRDGRNLTGSGWILREHFALINGTRLSFMV